mmetsp:Transcript_15781/g.17541  ORF Transcript_15781/g.17541 Transcript_15781/m.17541 type:complete len:80 (-) Transcript_15781:46-285(-)
MQLVVKTITCHSMTFEVDKSVTIKQVKQLVHEKEGIPIDYINFFYAEKALEDNLTLEDYDVQEGLAFYIVVRPPRSPKN